MNDEFKHDFTAYSSEAEIIWRCRCGFEFLTGIPYDGSYVSRCIDDHRESIKPSDLKEDDLKGDS